LTGSTFGFEDRAEQSVDEHELIIQQVASGDAEEAARAARQHMRAAAATRMAMIPEPAEESTGSE
jgi:DNA-binding GntR family transcriptional regulator